MYIRVLENRLSLTIVESIFIDSKAIPLLIIVLSILIIKSWFYKNITKHELVTVSLTSYTNKGIYIV